tara:strand:- start:2649 stop:3233 length:585 start_codon:yes stop_codon:yes gene_type:complete
MIHAGTYDKYEVSAQRHIDAALAHVDQTRVVVQAGGHVGCFPVHLAKSFEVIYTWEPALQDFIDLVKNIDLEGVASQVFVTRGMLGAARGTGLLLEAGSGSCKRLKDQPGPCPMYMLDDLALPVCDLIYLDVEGDELPILIGASETIVRCSPVIVTEDRPKYSEPGSIKTYLTDLGYTHVDTWMADLIWRRVTC